MLLLLLGKIIIRSLKFTNQCTGFFDFYIDFVGLYFSNKFFLLRALWSIGKFLFFYFSGKEDKPQNCEQIQVGLGFFLIIRDEKRNIRGVYIYMQLQKYMGLYT